MSRSPQLLGHKHLHAASRCQPSEDMGYVFVIIGDLNNVATSGAQWKLDSAKCRSRPRATLSRPRMHVNAASPARTPPTKTAGKSSASGQLCPQTQRETRDLGKWIKDSVIIAEHASPTLASKHHRGNERVPRLPESKGSNEGGDWAEPHCIEQLHSSAGAKHSAHRACTRAAAVGSLSRGH